MAFYVINLILSAVPTLQMYTIMFRLCGQPSYWITMAVSLLLLNFTTWCSYNYGLMFFFFHYMVKTSWPSSLSWLEWVRWWLWDASEPCINLAPSTYSSRLIRPTDVPKRQEIWSRHLSRQESVSLIYWLVCAAGVLIISLCFQILRSPQDQPWMYWQAGDRTNYLYNIESFLECHTMNSSRLVNA